MQNYLSLLRQILLNGDKVPDRTGVGTTSLFGTSLTYTLDDRGGNVVYNFPAVTTKKLAWKSVVSELLWFLEGSTNERRLAEILYGKDRSELTDKRTIWTDNFEHQGKNLGYEDGELGRIYSAQWRSWNGTHDQISELANGILKDPFSRRHIVSAWNVSDLDKMALPPCHVLQQYHVVPDHSGKPEYLDLNMYQRSADMFLGVPFNIASYALLLCIIARKTGLKARNLNMFFGDSHVYNNHIDAVHEQLERNPYSLPSLELPDIAKVDEMTIDWTPEWSVNDFKLINYRHHDPIKAKMAV
jgi:thymidylate synthase